MIRSRQPAPSSTPSRRTGTAVLVAAAILLVAAARTFVLAPGTVSSQSMEPALTRGDIILQYKPGPDLNGIHTGDIVTATSPADGSTIVKRVVATAGQTVELWEGRLRVDGTTVTEPNIDMHNMGGIFFGPVTVPEGHVFLMGDNRLESIDSRTFGPVPVKDVHAVVLATIPVGDRE